MNFIFICGSIDWCTGWQFYSTLSGVLKGLMVTCSSELQLDFGINCNFSCAEMKKMRVRDGKVGFCRS